jgi:hypothetical protein
VATLALACSRLLSLALACSRLLSLALACSRSLSLALAGATDRNVKIEIGHFFGKEKALGQDPYAHEAVRKVLALRRPHNLHHTSFLEQQQHTAHFDSQTVLPTPSGRGHWRHRHRCSATDTARYIHAMTRYIHGRQCQTDRQTRLKQAPASRCAGGSSRNITSRPPLPLTPAHLHTRLCTASCYYLPDSCVTRAGNVQRRRLPTRHIC